MNISINIEEPVVVDSVGLEVLHDQAVLNNAMYQFYGISGVFGHDINKFLRCLNNSSIQGKEQLGGSTVYITEEDVYLIDTLHLDTASYNYLMTLGKQSGNVAKLDIEEYTKFKEFVNMMEDSNGQ